MTAGCAGLPRGLWNGLGERFVLGHDERSSAAPGTMAWAAVAERLGRFPTASVLGAIGGFESRRQPTLVTFGVLTSILPQSLLTSGRADDELVHTRSALAPPLRSILTGASHRCCLGPQQQC